MNRLEAALRARRDGGGKVFVPYVTGGYPGVDAQLLLGLEAAGADAIEVGIPFSDPVMDGGVIQEASAAALARGAHPMDILELIAGSGVQIPLAVMTYVNPVYRLGYERFAAQAEASGVAGAIIPDLPVDESEEWVSMCGAHGVDAVQLAAPGSSPERLKEIAAAARGFVYCVAAYGVTGSRDQLSGSARPLVEALRPLTDLPLLVGVGISTPEQAGEACAFADGVIVGTAIMRPVVAGDPGSAVALAEAFRHHIPR